MLEARFRLIESLDSTAARQVATSDRRLPYIILTSDISPRESKKARRGQFTPVLDFTTVVGAVREQPRRSPVWTKSAARGMDRTSRDARLGFDNPLKGISITLPRPKLDGV
jgi:hypothetical protein